MNLKMSIVPFLVANLFMILVYFYLLHFRCVALQYEKTKILYKLVRIINIKKRWVACLQKYCEKKAQRFYQQEYRTIMCHKSHLKLYSVDFYRTKKNFLYLHYRPNRRKMACKTINNKVCFYKANPHFRFNNQICLTLNYFCLNI